MLRKWTSVFCQFSYIYQLFLHSYLINSFMNVFTISLHHGQNVIQGQFILSEINLVWIQTFLVALFFSHCWKKRWNHIFLREFELRSLIPFPPKFMYKIELSYKHWRRTWGETSGEKDKSEPDHRKKSHRMRISSHLTFEDFQWQPWVFKIIIFYLAKIFFTFWFMWPDSFW